MKFSKKLNIFLDFFTSFLKSTLNFEHFRKKDESHSLSFSKIIDCDIRAHVNVQRVMFQYSLGQSTC